MNFCISLITDACDMHVIACQPKTFNINFVSCQCLSLFSVVCCYCIQMPATFYYLVSILPESSVWTSAYLPACPPTSPSIHSSNCSNVCPCVCLFIVLLTVIYPHRFQHSPCCTATVTRHSVQPSVAPRHVWSQCTYNIQRSIQSHYQPQTNTPANLSTLIHPCILPRSPLKTVLDVASGDAAAGFIDSVT